MTSDYLEGVGTHCGAVEIPATISALQKRNSVEYSSGVTVGVGWGVLAFAVK
jgi:hypothetical protein